MSRVVLIVIDGCRPDALLQSETPHIDRLMAEGACCLTVETVTPSITLPCHFSIFTSLRPSSHKVLTNTGRPAPSPGAVTITEIVKLHGKRTAAVYSWEPLRNLCPPGSLDISLMFNTIQDRQGDLLIAAAAADCIRRFRPDFLFVYLEGVDIAGHAFSWMSPSYMRAVALADRAVGVIQDAIDTLAGDEAPYHLVVQSDHGGTDHQHEQPVSEVLTIPWIAAGPSIRKGVAIDRAMSILDTAPTLATLLGLPCHPSWEGRAPAEILS